MIRRLSLLAILSTTIALPVGGCRSCDSCHDYDSPVADCQCESCGYGRTGSASGYVASGSDESRTAMAGVEVGYE